MKAGITKHAVERYRQRVRQELSATQARIELIRLVDATDLGDVLLGNHGPFIEPRPGVRLHLNYTGRGWRVATVIATDGVRAFGALR